MILINHGSKLDQIILQLVVLIGEYSKSFFLNISNSLKIILIEYV